MTFSELLAAAYDDLNYQAAPAAAVTTRLKRWLNEGYQDIVSRPSLTGLRDCELPLTTTANRRTYGIAAFERIDDIISTENNRPLVKRTMKFVRQADPAGTTEGVPDCWVPMGLHPVQLHPNSTGLWAASSSASDTAITVKVRGIRANGDIQSEATQTLTGVTRIALGALTDYVAVTEFEVSAACVGDVTLYDAVTSGNALGRIPIGSTAQLYLQFRLWPTPADAYDLSVAGRLLENDLVNTTSVFKMKPSFSRTLLKYVRAQELRKKKDYGGFDREMSLFEQDVQRLMSDIEYGGEKPDAMAIPSNLGSYFPADE